MDVILDANAYIGVLHNHGRSFLQTNQFAELLTYLRRTSSRLVIPELTYNEVIARYRDRLGTIARSARDAWLTLQQIGMNERINFIEPNIESELKALGNLLHLPSPGVQAVIYGDYSGVDIKEVARRGIERMLPANEKGEELRDVILWLIVLQYAKRAGTPVAFVSGDKTFQDKQGALDPTLLGDVKKAKVDVTFYPSIREFVKGNALDTESIQATALGAYVGAEELRGIVAEQLLGSRFWNGDIVGAEVSRCELAEARQYRVGKDSFYVEARYTGEGIIRLSQLSTISFVMNNAAGLTALPVPGTGLFPHLIPNKTPIIAGPFDTVTPSNELIGSSLGAAYNTFVGKTWAPETTEKTYKCSFGLRLSLRISKGVREALEIDQFVLLGDLEPITAS
jgi:hypothetical protein